MTAIMASKIKACVFAGYGVLFDPRPMVKLCRKALGEKAKDLIHLWRQKQLQKIKKQTPQHFHDFWHLAGESLDEAMMQFKIKNKQLRARLMQAYGVMIAFPKIRKVLEKLKAKKIRTVLFSNLTPLMVAGALNRSKIWDVIENVSASQSGHFKPAKAAYQWLAEKLHLKPEEICYIATEEDDLQAADQIGMQTIYVDPVGEDEHDVVMPSLRNLTALEDIADYIGADEIANASAA